MCVLNEKELLMPNNFIREKIEFWNSVPTVVNFMHRTGNLRPNFSQICIKKSIFCGEQFPEYLAKSWKIAAPNSSIENFYGPTEATIYMTRYNYKQQNLDNNLPEMELYQLDRCFQITM